MKWEKENCWCDALFGYYTKNHKYIRIYVYFRLNKHLIQYNITGSISITQRQTLFFARKFTSLKDQSNVWLGIYIGGIEKFGIKSNLYNENILCTFRYERIFGYYFSVEKKK